MWRNDKPRRRYALGAIVVMMVMSTAPMARASAPDRWEWTDAGEVDCGDVTVLWESQGRDSLAIGARGSAKLDYFRYRTDGSVAYTSTSTGLTMTVNWNYIDKDLKVVDNGDGTLTIIGLATGNQQLRSPDGRLVRRDPGQIRYELLIDHNGTPNDPDDDELIADLGVIFGSTGLNEFQGSSLCEDATTYLG